MRPPERSLGGRNNNKGLYNLSIFCLVLSASLLFVNRSKIHFFSDRPIAGLESCRKRSIAWRTCALWIPPTWLSSWVIIHARSFRQNKAGHRFSSVATEIHYLFTTAEYRCSLLIPFKKSLHADPGRDVASLQSRCNPITMIHLHFVLYIAEGDHDSGVDESTQAKVWENLF